MPEIETQDVAKFTLSPKQGLALKSLEDPEIDELLYGGAKGGGKSVFGCIWTYYQAKKIIRDHNLQPSKHPIVVGFMGRKQSVDFTTSTLNTWKTMIPTEAYEIKKQEKLIVIENTVAILYGGMDDSDTVKKFNSMDLSFYFVDQAEECNEQDIGLLRGTFRLKIKGQPLEYKGLLTANPAICWLKAAFITTPQPKTKFIQALPKDNPYLPEGYIDQLKKAFEFRPELLRAYLEGSWDDLDVAFIVIKNKHVLLNVNNSQYDKTILKRITMGDISGEGDDETVIYDFENTRVVKHEIYSHRSTMDTVGRLQAHARENKSNMIAVDIVGIGKGVYDRLVEIFADEPGMMIYGFDGRVKANDERTYFNHKTEAWFYAAKLFHNRYCDIPHDPILISQLSSVTYEYKSNEKLAITPKDKLKEKMKHSPDRADCYVMGLDALRVATPIETRDKYERSRTRSMGDINPDTV